MSIALACAMIIVTLAVNVMVSRTYMTYMREIVRRSFDAGYMQAIEFALHVVVAEDDGEKTRSYDVLRKLYQVVRDGGAKR